MEKRGRLRRREESEGGREGDKCENEIEEGGRG